MSRTLTNICNTPVNYFTPMCKCINPPSTITNIATNMLAPYYCWYAPCFDTNVLKTPEIITGQQTCNVAQCNITVDQIKTIGGKIIISNICANSLIKPNVTIDLNPFEFEFELPFIINFTSSMLVLCFGILIYTIV